MRKRNNESKIAKGRLNENTSVIDKRADKKDNKEEISLNDEINNQGFSDWLRSSDGMEMMRLFVIANSVLVFVTMGWPKLQEAVTLLREYFWDED
nr:uncharacterized protein LOC117226029 [Megalopta genalis]